jgi:CheY-like chemotaxis protein
VAVNSLGIVPPITATLPGASGVYSVRPVIQPSAGTKSTSNESKGISGASKVRILFADDAQERFNKFKQLLVNTPVSIRQAKTVKEAIATLRKKHYDIISLDHDFIGGHKFVPDFPGDVPTIHEHFGAMASVAPHEPDGLDIANVLAQTPNAHSLIFIHSMNPVGVAHMKQVLPTAFTIPFHHLWLEINQIRAFVNGRQ